MLNRSNRSRGFTIVELLIVIVVIGILAALTMGAFGGIQKRAQQAVVEGDVNSMAKKIEIFKIQNGAYPSSITDCPNPAATSLCLGVNSGFTIRYSQKNNALEPSYEVASVGPSQFYYYSPAEIRGVNEFMQYTDLAPFIDRYGLVKYRISFDAKTANTTGNMMSIYMQNGSGAKYSFGDSFLPSAQYTGQEFVLTPTVWMGNLTNSILAFYGTYGTGNIPTVKNVRIRLEQ